jgi:hypothetical protein
MGTVRGGENPSHGIKFSSHEIFLVIESIFLKVLRGKMSYLTNNVDERNVKNRLLIYVKAIFILTRKSKTCSSR